MISGVDDNGMPDYKGVGSIAGNSGNGYARITLVN